MNEILAPVIKFVVALFVGLMIVFAFHQAVAKPLENIQLPMVPTLNLKSQRIVSLNCHAIVPALNEVKGRILANSDGLADYFDQVSSVYHDWYLQLAINENQSVNWPAGYFSPISKSADSLAASFFDLDKCSENTEISIQKIASAVKSCYRTTPAKVATLVALKQLVATLNDHQIAIEIFISRLQSDLSVGAHEWQQFDGQVVRTPVGTFSSLQKDSALYSEAAQLVRQNSELIADQATVVGVSVKELVPRERGQLLGYF